PRRPGAVPRQAGRQGPRRQRGVAALPAPCQRGAAAVTGVSGACAMLGAYPITHPITGAIMTDAIQAEGLVKRFGATTALAGVDLAARAGTVLAVLGPNGAGKTTAVRILATLLAPDGGRASVHGYDV